MHNTSKIYFTNIASYCFGKFAFCLFPKFILYPILYFFIILFNIKLAESTSTFWSFNSLNDLFIRQLNPSFRPWNKSENVLCSPVDGTFKGKSPLSSQQITIKTIGYDIHELIGQPLPDNLNPISLLNFYLSPKDSHHVYAPCDLTLIDALYIPGSLLPVAPLLSNFFPNVYTSNERIVLHVQHRDSVFLMVLVGALNVGHITLQHSKETVQSNILKKERQSKTLIFDKKHIKKGELMATFNMGSSVLLIIDNTIKIDNLTLNQTICYGESIGVLKH